MSDLEKTGAYQAEAAETPPVDAAPSEQPQRIGRYRLERVLGEGGFGIVYLAHDEQLQRLVAVKVPHRKLVSRPEDAEAYLTEARTVAGLDQPNIVPVYDVGSTEDCPCFVVSKFIEGSTLSQRIKANRPSVTEAVQLVAKVAETLHYAHRKGLVHRDIKPGNILLDTSGKPYVADFGLALKEENVGHGPKYAGTPAYMSPEQARGEGHRVDGRSDIFSLGVVLYELLAGRPPFRADSQVDLIEQITTCEPRPLRQMDKAVSRELERICFKALSKRAAERFMTAQDMADDLRHFLAEQTVSQSSGSASRGMASSSATPVLQPPSTSVAKGQPGDTSATTPTSHGQALKIVPKGLRSFDAHDADFFLELLPGPRDRDGLPDSIRFWKTCIEETDPELAFSVGLICGPSGCGKSSLVKAGLLPHLCDDVLAVYVEATAEETETRLLNGLRKRCPALPLDLGLKETVAALRRGQGIPVGKKVLLVLDQFEQWLHANKEENTDLVQALRQSDGGRVQCIVMVRDDFWMAVIRFMRELEIRLLEGQNSAAVDLFDMDHARKVLAAFGRAFGKLPEYASEMNMEQKEFLKQAVSGLAQEGKVVSVQVALFAEMMKGKPWTSASLKEVGGTQGVGVTFLEETFGASTSPPEHRYHQKAARAVLKGLLAEAGTDIKGPMRSQQELLEASGYASRPRDFDDLICMLDGEIRLITPTDPEGQDDAAPSTVQAGAKYYQLTHDYLVPSLRDWLTRKQKETRRGRAELLLADRAAVWNARSENRQLPSLLQWFQICCLTAKKDWTPPQRKMMGKAVRYHAARGLLVAILLTVFTVISMRIRSHVIDGNKANYAAGLVQSLVNTDIAQIPEIIRQMTEYRTWTDPLLKEAYSQALEKKDSRKQLHTSLALLPVDSGQVEYLYGRLLNAEPPEIIVIREALSEHKQRLTEQFWTVLENPRNDQDERLRASCALAAFAPDDPRWEKVSGDVAATLVLQKPWVIAQWTAALKSAGKWLIPPLADFVVDEKLGLSERGLIANVYGTYAADVPDALARLEAQLDEQSKPGASVEAKIALAKRQASIGAALVFMGRAEKVWPLLKHQPDPTLRSIMMERLGPVGVDAKVLIARLEDEKEVSVKRAILLSLGEFGLDRLSQDKRLNLLPRLLQLYQDDLDPGIHGAAEWLLRQWAADARLQEIDKALWTGNVEGKRQWYVNRQDQTMIIVSEPEEFWMGVGKERHKRHITRSFAIGSKEVTVEQFLRFRKGHSYNKPYAPTMACPVNSVSWYDAAEYCNWLSEQEKIPKDQWCYLPNQAGKYADGMKMVLNYLQQAGYRLPTEAEWEYACRAGAQTACAFGEDVELLGKYAWYLDNSFTKTHPVGLLKPNDFGLSDMYGNVWEWTQDAYKPYPQNGTVKVIEDKEDLRDAYSAKVSRVMRGGGFTNLGSLLSSAYRFKRAPTTGASYYGFRVARTLPPTPEAGGKQKWR